MPNQDPPNTLNQNYRVAKQSTHPPVRRLVGGTGENLCFQLFSSVVDLGIL